MVNFKLLSKPEEQQNYIIPLERKPVKFMNVISMLGARNFL